MGLLYVAGVRDLTAGQEKTIVRKHNGLIQSTHLTHAFFSGLMTTQILKILRFGCLAGSCWLMLHVADAKAQSDQDASSDQPSLVRFELEKTRVTVYLQGELFTRYHFADVTRPYLYPVIGPYGDSVTRHWPMKQVPGEQRDHVHHRSLWFAHGDVNGVDFWSEGQKSGKIVHREFVKMERGMLQAHNEWIGPQDKRVCTDTRTLRFTPLEDGQWYLDFEVTIHASDGPLRLGDTKEGTMAIRLSPELRLKGPHAKGRILNAQGQRDGACWGKRAAWVDYRGALNGKQVGVAIFDHSDNLRHPTWWHVRDYGLFAANPFGVHDFESKPEGTGDVMLREGQSLTLRYRFYFHRDVLDADELQKHFEQYK